MKAFHQSVCAIMSGGVDGGLREGGGAGEAVGLGSREVGGDPGAVARDLAGVGEEQEGAGDQGGVEDVHPGAAEDLLADDDAEDDAEGDLPQRDRGREGQREQQAGDEEALVDLVLADDGEDDLGVAADEHRDGVDRQEVDRAVDHAREDAGRVEAEAERRVQPGLPVGQGGGAVGDRVVGLEAGVVHGEQHAGQQGDHDGDHHALEVDRVAHVRGRLGDVLRGVEEGVGGLVERVELLELAALVERLFGLVEQVAQELHVSPLSRSR
jgi:hypothetical protein